MTINELMEKIDRIKQLENDLIQQRNDGASDYQISQTERLIAIYYSEHICDCINIRSDL